MKLIKTLIALLGIAITFASILVGAVYYGLTEPLNIQSDQRFEVKKGASSIAIGNQLADRGWIMHPFLTRVAARLDQSIVPKVGIYKLTPDMNLMDVMVLLDAGETISYSITLLEGKTYKQYLATMANAGNIEMTLQGLASDEIAQKIGLDVASPEGMLFANTYRYHDGDTDLDIFMQANRLLQATLEREWKNKANGLPYRTPYEALIMASIIEKETGTPEERPLVARVFVSRLERGMRLQTDPTVIYGMGDEYNGNITRQDLRTHTPYNTYRIDGLPPTPIANVGYEAIHAALHPGETDALYFVAKGDGSHVFSNTLREHNRAVKSYQLKRKEDYRSSPSQ
ncbi:endolytic transglycosylase MltG [Marinomonas piezotolerans]|uniref:Endolytic murein transglycosylase n=1 Tax=Marinomonas piezotolerans TaxID=2213058 RepID=A0A370UDU6_9GAMM|nr:endolytic transglycosylase MltG [Marinomonas piezotolerans]RDL45953.1 endolytic transglycosylase MltG [Marinomonas piezotolerans]